MQIKRKQKAAVISCFYFTTAQNCVDSIVFNATMEASATKTNEESTMRIELKNIKRAAFASQETHCFQATVYIDGVKAGEVSNEGHGGPNSYHPREMETRINEYAMTLPKVEKERTLDGKPYFMTQDADTLICDQLEAHLEAQVLKRQCSKKTLFRLPGHEYRPGEYHTLNSKFSPAATKYIRDKYGADAVILNETF